MFNMHVRVVNNLLFHNSKYFKSYDSFLITKDLNFKSKEK
ncbi:hypothetical protein PHEL85_1329 [Polaribacter sp. Hel1_85]|nr:hypothetical protein PHEL85_1329 [Polaribacter sp. Hel1_85]